MIKSTKQEGFDVWRASGPMGSEADEQSAFFRWLEFAAHQAPPLALCYHVPNGGSRDRREAARLKAQGVRAGVPDLCLPVPRGEWHGLYIEMKVDGNAPTKAQKRWLSALRAQGYYTAVCYGWLAARAAVCDYMGLYFGRDIHELEG